MAVQRRRTEAAIGGHPHLPECGQQHSNSL